MLLLALAAAALWYELAALAAGDDRAVREIIPVGMFDRAGCARRPH